MYSEEGDAQFSPTFGGLLRKSLVLLHVEFQMVCVVANGRIAQ
jgi:hypothetical protein